MGANHTISAATIVKNERNEVLLIKGPRRGWEMPGGIVEAGESLHAAAIRETQEECGLEVEITKFCGLFQNVRGNICNTLFLAKPIGGELKTSAEALAVGFFPLDQALEMVTFPTFKERILYSLQDEGQPFCIEFDFLEL